MAAAGGAASGRPDEGKALTAKEIMRRLPPPPMREVRKELCMTQKRFAAAIDMSKDAVASWECGRSRICRTSALKMSVRLQRNLIAGNTDPISVDELIQARVKEYERGLRVRLGL